MTGSDRVGTCRKCGQSLEPTDTECPSCGCEVGLPPVAQGFLGDPTGPTPAAANAVLVVGTYVIAMALGLVVAYALGLGVAYLGWVVVEDESLVMIGFGIMATGWLLGPLLGVGVVHFWRHRAGGRGPSAGQRST